MSKESKLYLFRDRKDYIKKMTNDDVINVIGTKGSGKTTSTLKYINDDNYIVINCDRLYEMPTDKVVEDKYLTEIRDFLKNKYGKICEFALECKYSLLKDDDNLCRPFTKIIQMNHVRSVHQCEGH